MKILKRALSVLLAISMLPAFAATGRAEDKEDTGMSFNPETVMWTNNKIENVLAQTGKYSNAAEVNPNADSKASSGVQNPYAKPGELLTEWAYSEFLWTNSYPIGNGRMAGMVAGGIDKEVIQINEDTAWDGSPYGTLINENGETVTTQDQANAAGTITAVNPTSGSKADGWKYFRGADSEGNPAPIGSADAIVGDEAFRTNYPDFADKSLSYQALHISNDKTQDAVQGRWNLEKMVEATFLGSPTRQRAYKSFAEVYLDFGQSSRGAENYVKSLDMEKGIVTVEYDYDGHHYKRESFASYPDQVVATHVESDADLDFSAEL
ncbi:MAG: glycoside hydrolase N-terminal domain-containing protein, partial [Clostridia bacterium]|nr:glycoside hydrolase N-terminal domain-containing protein [Clostridia bacterium]